MGNALRTDDIYVPAYERNSVRSPFLTSNRHRVETGLGEGIVIETSIPPTAGLVEAITRLHELQNLHDGWDSYSAKAVDPSVFKPALSVLIEGLQRCRSPRVTASSDGGLLLIWEEGTRELEVTVQPGGYYQVYFADDEAGEEYEPAGPVSAADVRQALSRYCQGL